MVKTIVTSLFVFVTGRLKSQNVIEVWTGNKCSSATLVLWYGTS